MIDLPFIRLHPDAVEPSYATDGSGCFDFYAIEEVVVPARSYTEVNLQLAFEVPPDFVLEVYSRSGHGFNYHTRLGNCVGLIDSDYRGAIKVQLRNDGDVTLEIAKGKACAQGKLAPRNKAAFREVDALAESERGEGGFGSTDV